MKFFDVFAGIGGFRMGLEAYGHECIGFCEIDKFARRTYKAVFETEGEVEYHDIRDVSDTEFSRLKGQVDILCGGFPCQAFSIAGRRRGFEDTRGTLFFEIARCAKCIQPRFLLLENVKGLLNHNQGRTFATILSTLDELGYDVEWQVLNSKDFGVPQNRERVFLVGHSRRYRRRNLFPLRREGSTSPLQVIGNTNPSGRGLSGQVYYTDGLAPTLVRGKGEGVQVALPICSPDRNHVRQNGRRIKDNQDPMFTLTSMDRHGVVVAGTLPGSYIQTSRVYDVGGLSPTLTTMRGGDKVPKIVTRAALPLLPIKEATKQGYSTAQVGDFVNLAHPNSKTRRGRVGKGLAHTVMTGNQQGVVVLAMEERKNQWFPVLGVEVDGEVYKLRIRRLTPRECFRLQGFPDWVFEKAEAVNSKTQLYKQAGNSVTVPVIEVLAQAFHKIEEEEHHDSGLCGKNEEKTASLLAFLEAYGIAYQVYDVTSIDKECVLGWMRLSCDCFEFLAPAYLPYKCASHICLTDFVERILARKETSFRFPIVVAKGQLYANVTVDEARMFLPREVKKQLYLETVRVHLTP